jgi:hypothetical protein
MTGLEIMILLAEGKLQALAFICNSHYVKKNRKVSSFSAKFH